MSLLTTSDVAVALRVSTSSVKRLIASGAIASVTVGSSRRIEPQAVADYLNRSRSTPAPA